MSALTISLITCALLVGGALTGALLRRLLPDHHLDTHAKDIVRLGCALIATISGLVHLKQRGLHMVNWCIWHYRFGQNTQGRFINSKVHALYFCKDTRNRIWNADEVLEPSDRATTYFDPRTHNKKEGTSGMRLPMDVWYGKYWGRIQGNNAERRAKHDNQIPEVYLERVIRSCSNPDSIVLDPFLGSGTTCLIARELGRTSIGIEYSADNAKSAFERITAGPIRVRRATPTRHVSAIFAPRARRSQADADE